jgi:peptidoglycan/xylan/chitin deacetylase (PgdA/CDA1 family)
MKFYPDRIPDWFYAVFSGLTWHGDREVKEVFLTFDDGPTPGVTEFVLETLAEFNFKGTFFCIGKCVEEHPGLFQRILDEGHAIGNHTHNHLNGWKTNSTTYLNNVKKAAAVIPSKIYRPPYGRIKPKQAQELRKRGYKIVMWDVLSGDFDTERTAESCLKNIKNHTKKGSIVVFHDSFKAKERIVNTLPSFCKHLVEQGLVSKRVSQP